MTPAEEVQKVIERIHEEIYLHRGRPICDTAKTAARLLSALLAERGEEMRWYGALETEFGIAGRDSRIEVGRLKACMAEQDEVIRALKARAEATEAQRDKLREALVIETVVVEDVLAYLSPDGYFPAIGKVTTDALRGVARRARAALADTP